MAAVVQQELRDVGAIIYDLGLRGRFHCQCHTESVELLLKFCELRSEFQFANAENLALPFRSNTTGTYVSIDAPHRVIIQSMLIQQSNWYKAFNSLQDSVLANDDSRLICFGPERCVPQTMMRKLGRHLIQASDFNPAKSLDEASLPNIKAVISDDAIAVIGMSCLVPGASDLGEFWEILCAGKSQHEEVPSNRFSFKTAWRDMDPKRKWYGNFIKDHDAFDHKFFKKSPREISSTDPQHRLMLSAAYQAVEQSGYFGSPDQDKHIGCYIGVGLVDYERNIACHPANAYSATGNLKSFTAGKISHYFGWTGPGLTIDTACSSSSVAVHSACRAILSGECSAALAGGVNVMTSPEWFQNLAGASFLSPTGQCKPFDATGDGYCRGEGAGAIFMKKLSSAIADGDQVYGVIASSAVYQNQNCTAITVPNATSLADLFKNVTRRAGLEPKQISVVEAHGTGTPVGDPAEYDSIRKVFGGSVRSDVLSLGSVKGLVGHTESASGIVALLKTLLMVHEGAIPPQASFQTINPSLSHSPSDQIEIYTSLKPWDVGFRAALINNYGASGSNATLVVTENPFSQPKVSRSCAIPSSKTKYPFWLCGLDEKSLRAYATRFRQLLSSKSSKQLSIANLAFQVSRQTNRTLPQGLIFSCSSVSELEEKLQTFGNVKQNLPVTPLKPSRPVILCFGGQISKSVALDRHIYESFGILRSHLDECDLMCQTIGEGSIYPEIFQKSPIDDIIKLQTALFAIQYSCARSWIDCGIKVAAVVGHSFGELTALCVSGVLSLRDALVMIAGRARIVKECWKDERGSMVAVEGDLADIGKLISECSNSCPGEPTATIACYNGVRSFTLAGSSKVIDAILNAAKGPGFTTIKAKKLNVTNAFHSTLVDPLMDSLEKLGQELNFRDPIIHLEMATESPSSVALSATYVASHMRNPVYFNDAVRRLSERYPSCIWLEAGSNSTITIMASRALSSPSSSHFQSVNITTDASFQFLIDATIALWRESVDVKFWSHHSTQVSDYEPLLLPPYQFERARHWMELKKSQNLAPDPDPVIVTPKCLWTFLEYQDAQKRSARFRVNTTIPEFTDYVSGHIIARIAPLCPSTLQLDIAIDALISLRQDSTKSVFQPQLQGMRSHAPMSMDPSKSVWLDVQAADPQALIWDWKMVSENGQNRSPTTLHVSGRVEFRDVNDPLFHHDFAIYERLAGRQRCRRLLDGDDADEVMQGRSIYKNFSEIVQYGDVFHGVKKIVGKDNESAGRIAKIYNQKTWLDVTLADSFCQVAGIFVNSMTDRSDNDMYISDQIDQWIRSPELVSGIARPEIWEVFASHYRPSEKEFISDVFVYDPRNGRLLEVILGIHYQKVSKAALGKVLLRLTSNEKILHGPMPLNPVKGDRVGGELNGTSDRLSNGFSNGHMNDISNGTSNGDQHISQVADFKLANSSPPQKKSPIPDISPRVRDILCNLSGLEPHEVKENPDLVELGIDSLMGMELAREIEIAFKCTLDTEELLGLTDFKSLIECIWNALGEVGDPGQENGAETATENTGGVDGTTLANGFHHINGTYVDGATSPNVNDKSLPRDTILEAFSESKEATDRFIGDHNLGNYVHTVLPKSTELCVVHILDAFDELGCSIRNANVGEKIERIQYLPRHEKFVNWIYHLLETEARLVNTKGSQIIRTAISAPSKPAADLLEDLIRSSPDHAYDHKLTYLTGTRLADCLTGKVDGLQLIFGNAEGRKIASGMYSQSPINTVWIKQIEDFLKRLFSKLSPDAEPIRILEMGAGTGGTTSKMVSLLAGLGIPVQYTVTDISASLVAGARKRFKEYPFLDFKVLDIEKPPAKEFVHSQHLVLATNCVHATHSLANSTKNIHDILRSDGLLLMLEMTEPLPWVDLIFGLVEGWWLFDDGRRHALAPPHVWEETLHSVGFGHVNWSDGDRPEASIQRIIPALASGPRYGRSSIPSQPPQSSTDLVARQAAVDAHVEKYTREFRSLPVKKEVREGTFGHFVLLTGATGSLGSHLVSYFAEMSSVQGVICLNRCSSSDATLRQERALKSRGIVLSREASRKLKIIEADTSRTKLGLSEIDYGHLIRHVTHIVHNAWPMSITRPINAFEPQFKTMQNLIHFASEASAYVPPGSKVAFQFISSVATVGYYSLHSRQALVPEKRMNVESVLPTGYGDAKLVCERMLDNTLHKTPEQFHAMVVRIGQISGSKVSGYWNPIEHLAFLIKSCQTLKVLPDLQGVSIIFILFAPV